MLTIKGDLWRQLENNPAPDTFLAWIRNNVPEQYHADSAFVYALVGNLVRYIAEKNLETEAEKEMIVKFKPILKAFLTLKSLQLDAIYALQVKWCPCFCDIFIGFLFKGLTKYTTNTRILSVIQRTYVLYKWFYLILIH